MSAWLTRSYDREENWLKFYLTIISAVASLLAFLFSIRGSSFIAGENFKNVIGLLLMILFLNGMLILFIHIRIRKNIMVYQNGLTRIRRYFVDALSNQEIPFHRYLAFRHIDNYKALGWDSRTFFISLFITLLDSFLLLGSLYFLGASKPHAIMISSFFFLVQEGSYILILHRYDKNYEAKKRQFRENWTVNSSLLLRQKGIDDKKAIR